VTEETHETKQSDFGKESKPLPSENKTRELTTTPFRRKKRTNSIWAKIKAKLSLCLYLTEHHNMEMYGGVDVQLHTFLISALEGGQRSDSLLGRFTPRGRALFTHWIGGWVRTRVGLD
jgi:hypothetical protein